MNSKGHEWDERDRIRNDNRRKAREIIEEHNNRWNRRGYEMMKYDEMVLKYCELNNIEKPNENEDEDKYLVDLYSFVNDAKFIDFALDECGIVFNDKLFSLDYDEDDARELERLGFRKNKDGNWDELY